MVGISGRGIFSTVTECTFHHLVGTAGCHGDRSGENRYMTTSSLSPFSVSPFLSSFLCI